MRNYNSGAQRNTILSADGKAYSICNLNSTISEMSERFARTKGHSMDSYDIEDLVQETWCKVLGYFPRYDSTQSPVEAWLWRIVYREGCDILRKRIRQDSFHRGDDYYESVPEKIGLPDEIADSHFRMSEFNARLGCLDKIKQDCVRLQNDGYKPKEIARILRIPVDKVYRELCRAKKKLGKDL